jgi:hypothetical protein
MTDSVFLLSRIQTSTLLGTERRSVHVKKRVGHDTNVA